MLKIFLLFNLLLSTAAAGVLLTEPEEREISYRKLHSRETFLGRKRVVLSVLGEALTPLFWENGVLTRYYEKKGQSCFRLTVSADRNRALRVRCRDFRSALTLQGFTSAKVISHEEALNFPGLPLSKVWEHPNVKLRGQVHEERTIAADRRIFGSTNLTHPTQDFMVSLKIKTVLSVKQKLLTVQQRLELQTGPFSYLPERSESFVNEINVSGEDVILAGDGNRLFIYKEWLPTPFDVRFLMVQQRFLKSLNELSQKSLSTPVCFGASCRELIHNGQAAAWPRLILIVIDLTDGSFDFK